MNKKGGVSMEAIGSPWKFFLLVLVVVYIFFFLSNHLNLDMDTVEVQQEMLVTELIYSPTCLAYEGDIGIRVGVIDIDKMNKENLNVCASKAGTGYRMALKSMTGEIIKTVDMMDSDLEVQIPVCKIKENPFTCGEFNEFVLYPVDEKLKPAILKIEVVSPDE